MKISLPANLVRRSLASHSWLGLLLGMVMYLICLSGTIVIFYEEIERWEQPRAEEYQAMDPELIEDAFNEFMTAGPTEVTEHMYVVYPSASIPRVKLSSDAEGWYLNADGSLGEPAHDDYSALLTGLHLNLHLPLNIGIVLVSAIGALLCGLIISGFLSHPSIIRDAFKLRLNKNGRVGQVDIHNRLSVWGSPFYLMIAVTGAYYGFILILASLFAEAADTSSQELIDTVFPPEPVLENQEAVTNLAAAMETVAELSPEGELLFLVVHDADTENRFMEFYVQQPGRLIYSENYRFDMAGNYLGSAGYSDTETAKQILYSVYRIHFGHFGGLLTKILYTLFGFALTWVSVSGINIWLEKRKKRDRLNTLWPALVWGTPLALIFAAFTQVIFHLPSVPVFWLVLLASLVPGMLQEDEVQLKSQMQILCALAILILLCSYAIRFGGFALAPAGLAINTVLLGLALIFVSLGLRNYRRSQQIPVFAAS